MFRNEKVPDEIVRETFSLKDKSNWKLRIAREKIRKDETPEDSITRILYRPFDIQWVFYHEAVIERSRKEVMRHMRTGENLALITSRLTKGETFKHAQVTRNIVEVICMSPKTSNNGFVFPLYLYPDTNKRDLFSQAKEQKKRQPNISPKLFTALSNTYKVGQTFLSDHDQSLFEQDKQECLSHQIFYYIYAVLYSNTYRTKYAEFLKIDFPRIPFTKDYELFGKMAEYGEKLVDLHLLKSAELDPPVAKFQGEGDERIEKLRYEEEAKRVYVNKSRYFEGVSKDVWQYQIGGYQVCSKWLKDRKGRRLSLDEIKHYCKIVTALQKTMEIQREVDGIYPEVERGTIDFEN